ncbi:MAG: MBOAT family protein [Alphaproteobacteria bacterium]|nr:MBOAT family protein [Alphaproteobacteria bacterium]
MVFSSLTFLFFFLPTCLIAYYAFPQQKVRNCILIVFSIIFYAWGEPIWVVLLIFSAFWDYLNGRFIDRFRHRPAIARLGVVSSVIVNLSLLGTFKYADFIVNTVNDVTGLGFKPPGILLPVGISFYTFEAVSYVIDVYRGEVRAQRKLLSFMLFLINFPRLVAGPIVRYAHVAHEIEHRQFNREDFSSGVTRFCRGLFKKVFIANNAGELCQQFLGKGLEEATVSGEWFGLLMFSLQIYFDFSGYSDMAIGLGRMLGFHYRENFQHPYVSTSLTEFWRRWHISMGSFFRDYVYIPLGGNRRHATLNIIIVWALTGLWHGASWNFIIWGLYFGAILLVEKNGLIGLLNRLPRVLRHIYALFFIVIGWAFFYFTNLDQLWRSLNVLFGATDAPLYGFQVGAAFWANALWLALALVLCMPTASAIDGWLLRTCGARIQAGVEVMQNLVFLGLSVVLLVGQTYNPFIYFRF